MDVVFTLVRITPNNAVLVAAQIASRLLILYGMLPYVPEGHFSIFMTCVCWSITEVVRFTLYGLKTAGVDMTLNTFADFVQTLRYTLFIVLYPVGITGELITCFKTW